MASFFVKVNVQGYGATAQNLVADGSTVDAFLQSRFNRNPSGNAPSPGAPDATGTTTAGLVTLTGITLTTPYFIRVQDTNGQQRWYPYPGSGGGASSGDPFTVVMPNPPPAAATPAASGGLTLIKTLTSDGTYQQFDFTSIPATYKSLWLLGQITAVGGGGFSLSMRYNGDSASDYWQGASSNTAINFANSLSAGESWAVSLLVPGYSDANEHQMLSQMGGADTANFTALAPLAAGWAPSPSVAINRLIFIGSGLATTFSNKSFLSLYGLSG